MVDAQENNNSNKNLNLRLSNIESYIHAGIQTILIALALWLGNEVITLRSDRDKMVSTIEQSIIPRLTNLEADVLTLQRTEIDRPRFDIDDGEQLEYRIGERLIRNVDILSSRIQRLEDYFYNRYYPQTTPSNPQTHEPSLDFGNSPREVQ